MHLIINTRPLNTSAGLHKALQNIELCTVQLPAMAIAGSSQPQLVAKQLQAARHDDVWIFTSINAVEQTFLLLAETAARQSDWPIMAILGKGSRQALQHCLQQLAVSGVNIIAPPAGSTHNSEGLLQHPVLQQVDGKRILLLNAPHGRDKLLQALQQRGARVHELAVYRRVAAKLASNTLQTIATWPDDLLTLWTSSASIRFLQQQFAAAASSDDHIGQLWQRIIHGRHLVLSAAQRQLLQQLDAVTISMADAPDNTSLARQLQALAMA